MDNYNRRFGRKLNVLICILLLSIIGLIYYYFIVNQSFNGYKHVIIIGVDGAGMAFEKVSSPNIDRIFSNYALRHDTKTENITYSAQNWGSILTGVACETHKYTNDSISEKTHYSTGILSVFGYVRKAIPDANLVSIVDWKPINNGIVENDIGVNLINHNSDLEVLNASVDYLSKNDIPTLMFIYFGSADISAHKNGGFSNDYYNTLETIDEYIGKIYDVLDSKKQLKDTLFMVVADHGETVTSHGGNSKEETSAILAVAGNSVNKTNFDAETHNRDAAPIVLYALGIDIPDNFVAKVPNGLFKESK